MRRTKSILVIVDHSCDDERTNGNTLDVNGVARDVSHHSLSTDKKDHGIESVFLASDHGDDEESPGAFVQRA